MCESLKCSKDKGLHVEKNLISARLESASDITLELYYEIILLNKSNDKISDIQIVDSFFGSLNTVGYITATADLTSMTGNLIPLSVIDISNGSLLDNGSYVNPHDIARLVLKIVITRSLLNGPALYNRVTNSIVVTGKSKCHKIQPIYVKSEPYNIG